MPNLVYYKDNSGVVSGPLKEEEATALFKANFFRPDHVFRVVDANNTEDFTGIDDLQTLNGAETPFGMRGEAKEEKELIRVYKELATVLKERNALRNSAQAYDGAKKRMIEQFKQAMQGSNLFTVKVKQEFGGYFTRLTNNSSVSVRCLIADSWDPTKTKVVTSKSWDRFDCNKVNIYIAPHISDDPLDGSEYVMVLRNSGDNMIKFE